MIRRIGGGSRALYVAYDNNHFYTFASINNLLMKDDTSFDIKYILVLLNSKLLNWYYVENFTNRSELTVNISKTYLDQLPIEIPTPEAQKVIVDTVNKIVTLTEDKNYLANSTKQTKVNDLEKQIDQLVYKLYGLTSKEIKIVENSK